MSPCILHLDIDAFFASIEQLRNPRLRGKPVAVGSGVVASASYEARRVGIHAGMPLREARERCRQLTVIAGHAAIYRCFSDRIFELAGEYSPALETFLDECYCDWNGTERLYPDPASVATEIRRRIRDETGLTVTAGLGRNRMLAKMASKSAKPDGLRLIVPAEEDAFIRDLPASRLPGVGPKTAHLLLKLNVRTIGEMRLLPRESLRAMLGLAGAILYDRCRCEDTAVISPREVPRSIRRETSFHAPATDRNLIEGTLYYLTERAANTLRGLHLEARQLGVKIRYTDGVEENATRKLPAPTQLDPKLFQAAVRILKRLYTRRVALHLVGVILTGFVADTGLRQLTFFEGGTFPNGTFPNDALENDDLGVVDPALAALGPQDIDAERRELSLLEHLDAVRERYGHAAVVCGKSLHSLDQLEQDDHGFILRTSSLTR